MMTMMMMMVVTRCFHYSSMEVIFSWQPVRLSANCLEKLRTDFDDIFKKNAYVLITNELTFG